MDSTLKVSLLVQSIESVFFDETETLLLTETEENTTRRLLSITIYRWRLCFSIKS